MAAQQGINHITVLGNVVSEPKRAADALALVLECVERVKKDDGWGDRSVQVPILIYGKRGESLASVLKPGDRVLVQGAFDVRGEKRFVRASNVVLCGGKKPGGTTSGGRGAADDEEIPF
jgi:Single-strand binding protein family